MILSTQSRSFPLLASLLAGVWLGGCGKVTIDPGGNTTITTSSSAAGSGGDTSAGGGGFAGGGAGSAGQGAADPGIELVTELPFPHELRINATATFVMTTEDGLQISRIDKVTGEVTPVSDEFTGLTDYAVNDATVFTSESISSCFKCSPGPGMVYAAPATGGSPALLATAGPWLPYRLAVAAGGLYANNGATAQLLRIPFTGGEPEIVLDFGVGPSELARDASKIYFRGKLDGAFRSYDEITHEVVVLAPTESGMRHLTARDGAIYWLVGNTPTKLRRAKDGQVETLMVSPSEGVALAVSSSHAFLVARPSPNDIDYPHGKLWAVPLAGGQPQLLVDELSKPTDVEVDETHVYWLTEGDADESGALWRMPVPE